MSRVEPDRPDRARKGDVTRLKRRSSAALNEMFQTRSHAWQQVGLARQISQRAARQARRQAAVLLPLLAGPVLIATGRSRVGARVRFRGAPRAGQVEGVVASLALLYTTLASGEDSIMVPNSVVLSVSVTPLREPSSVDMRARLPMG